MTRDIQGYANGGIYTARRTWNVCPCSKFNFH